MTISDAYVCEMPKQTAVRPSKPLVSKDVVDAESAALRVLWAAKVTVSQAVFAAEYQIGGQSMLTQYLNGKRPLNLPAAIAFSRGFGVKIGDFSPRLAELVREAMPHTVSAPPSNLSEAAQSILDFLATADATQQARLQGFTDALRGHTPDDNEVERRMPITKHDQDEDLKKGAPARKRTANGGD